MGDQGLSYLIRRATLDDIKEIATIELASAAHEGRLNPLTFSAAELEQLWYDRLLSGEYDVLVAVSGAIMLGFVGIIAPRGKDGFIQAIYIDPNFYRCGIGTTLLQASERICLAKACPRVALYVEPLNRHGQSFYAKAGYTATDQKYHHLTLWVKEIAS